jgi:hypothetical protein
VKVGDIASLGSSSWIGLIIEMFNSSGRQYPHYRCVMLWSDGSIQELSIELLRKVKNESR